MSSGLKRPYAEARATAEEIVGLLQPFCVQIDIAGSVRRKKAMVSDIEIVAIPKPTLDLFGQPLERTDVDWWLDDTLPQSDVLKNGPRYKQFIYRDTQVDLFLATPMNYGYILMLRTGDADFSHRMVTLTTWGGFLPAGLRVDGGQVWRNGIAVSVPDEETLFQLWGMAYIPPEQRAGQIVRVGA